MASLFGHAAAAVALSKLHFTRGEKTKVMLWAIFCSCLPDADVIAFRFDIPYTHQFGHRGFTHSLVFGLVFGILLAWVLYRKEKQWWRIASLFVMATASHGLLDMMTNGGTGVALWWPFSHESHFFSFRPIGVSPLGAAQFFSEWGMRVVQSELIWIGIPSLALYLFAWKWAKTSAKLLAFCCVCEKISYL